MLPLVARTVKTHYLDLLISVVPYTNISSKVRCYSGIKNTVMKRDIQSCVTRLVRNEDKFSKMTGARWNTHGRMTCTVGRSALGEIKQ